MKPHHHSNSIRMLALAVLLFSGTEQAVQAQSIDTNITAIEKMTIKAVVRKLENDHVKPKAIDDNFSRSIWKKYLEGLDPNKDVLLQSDFQDLKKYELNIDDELHEGSVDFFAAAYQIFHKRLLEAQAGYKKILERPMDFSKNEMVQLNGSLLEYPVSKAALEKVWQKRAKYFVLKKMIDLDSSKVNHPALEKQARLKVDKWLGNVFKNLTGASALNERFSQYVNTITLEVDPHTSYFAPVKVRSVNNDMAKRYFGIGLELQDKEGDVFVKSLKPGGVAIKSGLIDINDRILRISDPKGVMVDIAGLPLTDVADLIKGDKDTEVSLGLLKSSGQEKMISLKRAEIKDEEGRARSAVIEKNGLKIGYIYLQEFYVDVTNPAGFRCADDVGRELLKLKAQNVNGVIVDLRNNGGGSLDEVVKMSGYFLGSGPKVQTKAGNGIKIYTSNDASIYDGPLAVMINEQSASASEIFAAVIQDYKRGIIIGSQSSYGKGTAQGTLPMGKLGDQTKGIPDLSFGSLRLTQYQFYRVNGASTQLKGVKADVVLPGRLAYLKIKEIDNPTALHWDSIPAAKYSEFNKPLIWNNIINLANEAIGHDEQFKTIDENSRLLAQHQLDPVNLISNKFIRQQDQLLAYSKMIDQTAQLTGNRKLKIIGTMDNSGAAENEWYGKWLNTLSTDLYLDKGLDVIRVMNQKM
ncbi:carboxy terminal-processing peptidase [Pedobacter nutrimenti]|uniref:carboxy terminal-processing peptidase n=1 Tax=Pedobacter nutrimenti TaxID=1241337 RepID=UPI002931EF5D|nr:carboxy terminal-processing peptidase [Pedobacter nutrimenti]